IGAHHGMITREKNDISGAAVHMASRMGNQAKSDQVVISGYMREMLGSLWKSSTRQIDLTRVPGIAEEVELYEVHWKSEGVTSMVPVANFRDFEVDKGFSLQLIYNGREIVIDENSPYANLGRSEENEVPVNHDLVSRVHTRVELYKGKFRLQDKSTNGTYVRPASGQPVFVRRDYLTLSGSGMFGLGQDVTANSPYAIRYIIRKTNA
ncbi:MAG: FHA domain-containing protein, partial [Gammaproteobacteria bacterium]|nr:FHA domain-containing protein [Gammaproteobacteria bacterium]